MLTVCTQITKYTFEHEICPCMLGIYICLYDKDIRYIFMLELYNFSYKDFRNIHPCWEYVLLSDKDILFSLELKVWTV